MESRYSVVFMKFQKTLRSIISGKQATNPISDAIRPVMSRAPQDVDNLAVQELQAPHSRPFSRCGDPSFRHGLRSWEAEINMYCHSQIKAN